MTRELERLRQVEAEITEALKGWMPNIQRALLVADRKDVRAAISAATPTEKTDAAGEAS